MCAFFAELIRVRLAWRRASVLAGPRVALPLAGGAHHQKSMPYPAVLMIPG
jgi:hypothetical protein